MRRVLSVLVVGITFVGLVVPAGAADNHLVEVDDMLIPDHLLADQSLIEFPNAPLIPPPDLPACEVFKAAFDRQATAGAATAHQEWHTADSSFTLAQTVVTPTGQSAAKAYFKTISKKSFSDCIEAMNGEDDDNPAVAVNVEVTKVKTKIKGADGSAVYGVDATYDPETGPTSYGMSLYVHCWFKNAILMVVIAHFSMDPGDLEDFEQETRPYLKFITARLQDIPLD